MWLLGLMLAQACSYYKPVQVSLSEVNRSRADQIMQKGKGVVILRSPKGDFLVNNFAVHIDEETISGTLREVPKEHRQYIDAKGKSYSYGSSGKEVLKEVHLYTEARDEFLALGRDFQLPVSKINQMELLEDDKSKSSGTTVALAIGATAVLVGVIVAATSSGGGSSTPDSGTSSCPYISVFDGEQFVLQGESYGGAIYPSLAREDFLPLPATKVDREVKLLFSNELEEKQYIDMAFLLLVSHDKGEEIVVDEQGKIMKVSETFNPTHALLNGNKDMLGKVMEADYSACTFNDLKEESPINELIVAFDKPAKGGSLGLVLDMRSSKWFEFLFGQFTTKFGRRYDDWVRYQSKRPAEELLAWQESQHMPLSISVKTAQGWQEIAKHNFIGPLMNRKMAVSLDGVSLDSERIELKFSTGFMYWELDQVRLAVVEVVKESSIVKLQPKTARDHLDEDVLPSILSMDKIYLEQAKTGDKLYLSYDFKEYDPSKTYTAFVHTKGFYEPIRNYQGPVDRRFVMQFNEPGIFASFSRNTYRELVRSGLILQE